MESVVEKQRHMTSIGNGSVTSSLLVSSNPNNNLNNNSIISTVSGSNSNTTSNSHSHSYMSSLPLTSLVPPSSVALSSQTSSTSSSALKLDGINCPTIGLYTKNDGIYSELLFFASDGFFGAANPKFVIDSTIVLSFSFCFFIPFISKQVVMEVAI